MSHEIGLTGCLKMNPVLYNLRVVSADWSARIPLLFEGKALKIWRLLSGLISTCLKVVLAKVFYVELRADLKT